MHKNSSISLVTPIEIILSPGFSWVMSVTFSNLSFIRRHLPRYWFGLSGSKHQYFHLYSALFGTGNPISLYIGDGLSMLAIRLQALRNKAWNLSVASFVLRNVKRVKPRSLRSTISLLNGGNSSESLIHFILTSFLHHFGIVVDVSNNLNIAFIIVDNDSV